MPTAVPTEVPSTVPTLVPTGVGSPTPVPANAASLTPTPVPTDVFTSTPTTVPGAFVVNDTLCYEGPGAPYDVVSAIRKGVQVTLLGVGNTAGWFVVKNPTYHDPCWLPNVDLQVPPGIDLAGLKVFVPLPLPAASAVASKVPTAVPTSSGKP